jgi:hypothetical protein
VKSLVWVLLVLASVIIEAELIAWCRLLQRWLIRRAAAPLPMQHRDRYTREWYAELENIPDGPATQLSWVCLWCFAVPRWLERSARPDRSLGSPEH